jgi:uncharacterized protein YbcI
MLNKGKLEDIISSWIISYQKERLGRGAESAKTYIIDDMIIIRSKSVLTPAEKQLALKEKGKCLIKELRYQLEELIRPELELLVEELFGRKIISLHNDISTKTGERIDIIIMDKKIVF